MPLQSIDIHADGTIVGIWHMTECNEELRAGLSHPELYAERIAEMRPGGRREREILVVRCLLKAMTGKELLIEYDSEGKPSIARSVFAADLYSDPNDGSFAMSESCYISISHTTQYAAAIISQRRVGIDIETIGNRVERVRSKFMNEQEEQMHLSRQELHLLWCTKEAIYKLMGHDYYDLQHLVRLESMTRQTERGATHGTIVASLHRDAPRLLTLSYSVNTDFALVWVVDD